jgi:hypothetical protein
MSFWLVEEEERKTGEFELGGGVLEPIPSGTTCIAFAEEAKWDDYEGEEYISLKWKILSPDEYKNRIVFQKLKVMQQDKEKAKKAQQMLLSINFNAKGSLDELKTVPDTEDLQKNLCNKPMLITLQVWEMNDRKGNWVSKVAPKGSGTPDKIAKVVKEDPVETDDIPDF